VSLTRDYSPSGDPKPLGGYAILTGVFAGSVASYGAVRRHQGWELPERVGLGDTMLLSVAAYKLSRLITKDRVTSFARAPFTRFEEEAGPAEVSEVARGQGLRRAVGELAICPYCVGQWVAAGLVASYIRDPGSTRSVASVFAVLAASDVFNQAWIALQERT